MYHWLAVPIAYLIGSVTGANVAGYLRGVDVRRHGSGNAGTTNTLRVLGLWAAVGVLVIDVLKGVLAVLIARYLLQADGLALLAAAVAVVAGHNWPLYFGFRGGKGIATSIGVLLAIDPVIILVLAVIMAVLILLTRYVSLGSITGALVLPLGFWFRGYSSEYIIFAAALAAMAIYRHRSNIVRLWQGTENKIGKKA